MQQTVHHSKALPGRIGYILHIVEKEKREKKHDSPSFPPGLMAFDDFLKKRMDEIASYNTP